MALDNLSPKSHLEVIKGGVATPVVLSWCSFRGCRFHAEAAVPITKAMTGIRIKRSITLRWKWLDG